MQPVAFHIGTFAIHWYGIFVGLGCLLGLWSASRRGLRSGLQPDRVYDLGLWMMVGVVIGARGLFIFTHWETDFAGRSVLSWLNLRSGGLVFYGGFLGAAAAAILYCQIRSQPLWKLADAYAPSIALGSVLGRIGCLMTGCCYGSVCDLPWAVRFPTGHATHGTAVHPVQIYDALLNLVVWAILEFLHRKRKFEGQVFAAWLLTYPIARSIAELFRGDYPVRYLDGRLTPAHLMGAGLFATGCVLYFWLLKRSARPGSSPSSSG